MTSFEEELKELDMEIVLLKGRLEAIKSLKRRFHEDDFPHLPLMTLYKRPPFPSDMC